MSDILDIVCLHEIFNLDYIKQILKHIVQKEAFIHYLQDLDFRSFNEIKDHEGLKNMKVSHCINFIIDNRKNLTHIIDYEKLKKKKIKLNHVVNFNTYSKWINIYKLIGYIAKMNT